MSDFKFTEPQRRWIDALRSGQYAQTKFVLTNSDSDGKSHCCLGVACELFKDELNLSIFETGLPNPVANESASYAYNNESVILPGEVRAYLNLRSEGGETPVPVEIRGEQFDSLAGMNDMGIPFETIANIMEEKPEFFFNT